MVPPPAPDADVGAPVERAPTFVHREPGSRTVTVIGELDAVDAGRLLQVAGEPTERVDLRHVPFLSAAGIGALVSTFGQGPVEVIASAPARRALELGGTPPGWQVVAPDGTDQRLAGAGPLVFQVDGRQRLRGLWGGRDVVADPVVVVEALVPVLDGLREQTDASARRSRTVRLVGEHPALTIGLRCDLHPVVATDDAIDLAWIAVVRAVAP